jgi:chaperonin GroEL
VVDADYTTLIEGVAKADAIKARCEQIRHEMEETDSDYDREKLQERLSKLSGGVCQILVGAATETDLKERKKLLENALSSVRAALEDGIVPGGGVALLRASKALDKFKAEGDERIGVGVVARALEAPMRQISENAGAEGALVVKRVREGKGDLGYDAESGEFRELRKAGIVDPAKVVYHALLNAASVSSMLLTTDTLISEIREKKKEKPAAEDEDMD